MREVDRKKTQTNNHLKKNQVNNNKNSSIRATSNGKRTKSTTNPSNKAKKAAAVTDPPTAAAVPEAPPPPAPAAAVEHHLDHHNAADQDLRVGKEKNIEDEKSDSDSETTSDDTSSSSSSSSSSSATGVDSQLADEEESKEDTSKPHNSNASNDNNNIDEHLLLIQTKEKEQAFDDDDDDEVSPLHDNSSSSSSSTRTNQPVVSAATDANQEEDNQGADEDDKIKIERLEQRIELLQDELTQVAALETSIYSAVPEHGSSAHKLHTPARRLSRLYIHACKHWAQAKRASIAGSIVSGLVLVARTSGSDVSRLTYWLSNTIVLRETISQALGNSRQMMSSVKMAEFTSLSSSSSGGGQRSKQVTKKKDLNQFIQDWQETRTFTAALERIEAWIFLRLVDSIWWQIFAPNMNMQSRPDDHHNSTKSRPGHQTSVEEGQGGSSFSTGLWENAFQNAFRKLCPVRAGGNECGCLSVLPRMVLEQSLGRLDVAMFNAILRESANQVPTDPVSDPILDPYVLPIPAGQLSFASGAQLKNAVGNWSRWLSDSLGMETRYHYPTENNQSEGEEEDNTTTRHTSQQKCFRLLDQLSDLLMLPKDMLSDRSVRKEVCPSITLPLIKRVLCNFSPDEFCPDDVPGEVLEALNAESVVDRRQSTTDPNSTTFPYTANPIVYSLPPDVADKVAQIKVNYQLGGRIQSKEYASDEEPSDLSSPLASSTMTFPAADQSQIEDGETGFGQNLRYQLLQEVWSG